MRKKWLTIVLLAVGAGLIIFASGIEPKAYGEKTVGFKIAGLIMLMYGIYRASRVKPEVFSEEVIEENEED